MLRHVLLECQSCLLGPDARIVCSSAKLLIILSGRDAYLPPEFRNRFGKQNGGTFVLRRESNFQITAHLVFVMSSVESDVRKACSKNLSVAVNHKGELEEENSERTVHRAIGLDLSAAMLTEARVQADGRGLKASFQIGDAVPPPLEEASLDAIVCRHFLWTLRQPEVAFANWLRLLRPKGRVVVIDGFWFAQARPEEDFDLFKQKTWVIS